MPKYVHKMQKYVNKFTHYCWKKVKFWVFGTFKQKKTHVKPFNQWRKGKNYENAKKKSKNFQIEKIKNICKK
jgi:hypothetical protein